MFYLSLWEHGQGNTWYHLTQVVVQCPTWTGFWTRDSAADRIFEKDRTCGSSVKHLEYSVVSMFEAMRGQLPFGKEEQSLGIVS